MNRPGFKLTTDAPKCLINIGAGMDIPTGHPLIGAKGETLINGGLNYTTGVAGIGNSFKSTLIHYMALSASNVVQAGTPSLINTYDTEVNISDVRLKLLAQGFENIDSDTLFDSEEGLWCITDKSIYSADEWMTLLREYLAVRRGNRSKEAVPSPFVDRQGTPYKVQPAVFVEVDSLTEFETTNTISMQDDQELGDSKGNTLFMKQGLVKSKFLMELPRLTKGSDAYFLMTAHVGQEMSIQTGPRMGGPTKKLHHLKGGNKIKGVSDKYFFLLGNLWFVYSTIPLVHDKLKTCYYPSTNKVEIAEDLVELKVKQLRSKSGPSGYTLSIIASQSEGVLSGLTEYLNIKKAGMFGLSGGTTNHKLYLRPDTNISRVKVRSLIKEDKLFARALNITSELQQIQEFWPQVVNKGLWCTPEELYIDLTKQGFDWDVLLNTRGWWTYNQYSDKILPFLSTMDLLRMRKGLYTPYWLK